MLTFVLYEQSVFANRRLSTGLWHNQDCLAIETTVMSQFSSVTRVGSSRCRTRVNLGGCRRSHLLSDDQQVSCKSTCNDERKCHQGLEGDWARLSASGRRVVAHCRATHGGHRKRNPGSSSEFKAREQEIQLHSNGSSCSLPKLQQPLVRENQ